MSRVDFIMWNGLIDDPDFGDLAILTKKIEKGTLEFIDEVESFLHQFD